MNNKYKIVISNRNLYREVELPVDAKTYRVGTTIDCDFRLHKELFFEELKLDFVNNNGNWTMMCSDNIYITIGDTRRLLTTELRHGDTITVKYQESNHEVFNMEFMVDFDNKKMEFERRIDVGNISRISIGEKNDNHIILRSEYITNDKIELIRNNNDFILEIKNTTYGVYHNGNKANNKEVIKNGDFISLSDFSFYYKDNALWTEISEKYGVRNLSYMDFQKKENYPMFVRNTRVKAKMEDESIKILDPVTIPIKPQLNIVTSLMPTLMMFALVVVLRGIMSTSGGTYVIFSICSMGMGVITSILNIFNGQKKYKKECAQRVEVYNAYIDKKRDEIIQARELELSCLKSKYYSTEENISHLNNFDSCLFDRTPEDEDFLEVYLGTGRREAVKKIDYKEQEKLEIGDDLCQLPSKIADEYKYIENAPITISLKDANAVGIIGENELLNDMLKCFIVDLISRQYNGDLKIYTFIDEETDRYEWIRMLPHFQHGNLYRNIVCDNQSKNNIFESLYKELTLRSEVKGIEGFNVILIMNDQGIKSHPISRFIEKASELNTVFVFFENKEEHLPLYCSKIVNLEGENKGILFNSDNRNDDYQFSYIKVDDSDLHRVAQNITPVYCEEISLEGAMRKKVSLFELLGIYLLEDLNLKSRWKSSKIYESMAVPLGVNAKDDIVFLDLHEKFHGPHGLVAGTTGSGKSEVLLTYILAAATLFHPYEISFVIIDFKGGGMANQIKNLPHMVGAITNIDGKEINRSLKSIKAELLKRQALFAQAEVNHVDKYIKLFKEGKVETALPHLVIIVDEFAELKAEQPEFMKELISTARIGRSLGVHLILATQKPAGQVNEQIWSNSKFKLCLKVQTREDSNEVLKSPLAAEIREPGRAYLQVGNNEIFELFQSGFSGAAEKSDDRKVKEFKISSLEFTGKRTVIFEQKAEKSGNQSTQLDALVNYISDFCQNNEIQRLQEICLQPLQDYIEYDLRLKDYKLSSIPIGIYDDPDTQYQGCAKINICDENTLVIGSTQTGKTNFLQILIRTVVSKFSPKEAVFYIADFGAMYLKNFEKLNHVGGVVTISEEERVKNLFKLLSSELQYRKSRFMEIGLSSFAAYKEAGYTDLPHIFFIIDNFSMFKELYADSYEDVFMYLCREGIACGISIIITNAQTNGIGFKYMANFACKLALKCNDSNEYGFLFDRCRIEPKDVPGRMLIKANKELYELQTYLAFEGEKEVERSNAIKSFVSKINQTNNGIVAKQIPSIPDKLTKEFLENNYSLKTEKYLYPIALNYATVDVVSLDFKMINEFCIIGRDNVKKYFALNSILMAIEKKILSENVRLYIVDSVERPLKERADSIFVERYTIDYSEIGTILDEIYPELERRYEVLMQDGLEGIQEYPLYVVLINNKDVIEYISTTKELINTYNKILKQFKSLGIVFIFSDIEDVAVGYNAPELLKKLKETRKGIVTSELKEFKFADVPSNIIRSSKSLAHGDAYMMDGTEFSRIKLIEGD